MALDSTSGEIAAIAAALGGGSSNNPTSLIAPGVAPLGYRTGWRYLASDLPAPEFVAGSLTADRFYIGNSFVVREDVTFTKMTMIETASGSAGTIRVVLINASDLTRYVEVGNITTFAGAAAERSNSSISLSLTKGQRLIPGFSVSAGINCLVVRSNNATEFIAANGVLMAEQGVPSWYTLSGINGDVIVGGGGYQSFTYTGTTSPTTAAPTTYVASPPALWFSK